MTTDQLLAELEVQLAARRERKMGGCKVVPVEPTAEMVAAAQDAYMPFGDMDVALRMALLAAPAVQGESDVAGLVEALEIIEKGEDAGPDGWGAFRWADCRNIARAALAAHRKGGE